LLAGLIQAGEPPRPAAGLSTHPVVVLVVQGTVEVSRAGQAVWDPASTREPYCVLHPGDRLRTLARSRATLRLSDLTVVQLGPESGLELLDDPGERPAFALPGGRLYLFHRGPPGTFRIRTPLASPVIRGTEFALEVGPDGATTIQLFDGRVSLGNSLGTIELATGEAGLVQPNRPPTPVATRPGAGAIQWCLYYPAVLDPDEIPLPVEARTALEATLTAFRAGDPVDALRRYPPNRRPDTPAERLLVAALELAVGEVAAAESRLETLDIADERLRGGAAALHTLIATVTQRDAGEPVSLPDLRAPASALLAQSYAQQSRAELEPALASARAAVKRAPGFAFAWARLAELEFSFGRTQPALAAVRNTLRLAPRHAPAMALEGFLLAARNETVDAEVRFDQAIDADGALGNAWLGRGLCRIRRGQTRAGLADLLVAAAVEPNRAVLRSYLGKAFAEAGAPVRALRELELAMTLDPRDPTAWLYAALLNQERNQLNQAVRDLERSRELNDQRQLYRSRLLLDQDRAVRQANLAGVFAEAGLPDQAMREAGLAVTTDYAHPSAHLFLANAYAELRDPALADLRYETTASSEYLLAYLLAPVGGGPLSPYVSQQEYSRLFVRQGLDFSSSTEYRSTGDWRQRAVQYGNLGSIDYALDGYYLTTPGQQPNGDLELLTLTGTLKAQCTPQDTVFFQALGARLESGDIRHYLDPALADPDLRIKETQQPTLFAGYHRAWGPASHTLVLAGRVDDTFELSQPQTLVQTLRADNAGVYGALPPAFSQFDLDQATRFVAYSVEAQQVQVAGRHTLVLGGRFQTGSAQTDATLGKLPPSFARLDYPSDSQSVEPELRRAALYAMDTWEVVDGLALVGGLTADWLLFPLNVDLPPVSDQQRRESSLGPKLGAAWTPTSGLTVRTAYSRSLGGLYQDASVRLEPTQVAGLNQAFRSLAPESVTGLWGGAHHETWAIDVGQRLGTRTYLGLGGQWLRSTAERTVGVFVSTPFSSVVTRSGSPEELEFEERSLAFHANRLVGRNASVGLRYRLAASDLWQRWSDVPPAVLRAALTEHQALLHQLSFAAVYNHPAGWFARAQASWYAQTGQIESLPQTEEHVWQFDIAAGYRFARRRAALTVGCLNLTDSDYRLDPLSTLPDLPRGRTLVLSLSLNF
jgi:Tfp pilus assembly protein PilF